MSIGAAQPCASQRPFRRDRKRPIGEQRIDHDIAHEAHARGIDAFAGEVVVGSALGRIEQIGDLIGEHAVDFLGHRAVEAAQSCFDVRDGHPLLHGNQRARERRVDVADDDDARGVVRVEHRLEAAHRVGRLHRVRPDPTSRLMSGTGRRRSDEQPIVHVCVVVLARVDQKGRHCAIVRCESRAGSAPPS
jgi:hypothetical protein